MDYYMAENLNPIPGIGLFGSIFDAEYDDPKWNKMRADALECRGDAYAFGIVQSSACYKDDDHKVSFSPVVISHHNVFGFYGIVFDTEGGKGWGTIVHYHDPIGDDKVVTWWWKDFLKDDGLDYGLASGIQAASGIEVYDFQELFNAITRVKVDKTDIYHGFDEFVAAAVKKFCA